MTSSSRYGFNIFVDTDKVNINKINENFQNLDGMYLCRNREIISTQVSGDVTGTMSWVVETSSNKIVRYYGRLVITNLLVNKTLENRSAWFRTDNIVVKLPKQLNALNNVQITLQDNGGNEYPKIIRNVTQETDEKKQITFRIISELKETTLTRKVVYFSVDGTVL